jgi:Sulfate permease family
VDAKSSRHHQLPRVTSGRKKAQLHPKARLTRLDTASSNHNNGIWDGIYLEERKRVPVHFQGEGIGLRIPVEGPVSVSIPPAAESQPVRVLVSTSERSKVVLHFLIISILAEIKLKNTTRMSTMMRAHVLLSRHAAHGRVVASRTTARFQSTTTKTTRPIATIVDPTRIIPTEQKKKRQVDDGSFDFSLGIRDLIPEWKRMFSKETLFTDISAGVTVGCIAVPLSLAIAVASGVPAEVGLVTAAVSGVAGAAMGGTTLAITGPAAAISLLVVGAVEQHGLEALPFITLACGGLQLASGVTRLGVYAKMVPVSVIAGFTTGVGTLILTGQIPKALGLIAPHGLNTFDLLLWTSQHLPNMNPSAAALAAGTSAAMFMLPKVHPKMPSALLAVGGATVATHTLGLDVSLIGSIPAGLEAFSLAIPALPPMDAVPSLLATTLLIYSMTSVESLLSCAALEKMKKTTYKHSPDQELVGQGLANMGAALFFGTYISIDSFFFHSIHPSIPHNSATALLLLLFLPYCRNARHVRHC